MKSIEIKNYIKDPNSVKKTIIFHVIYCNKQRIKSTSGISVLPNEWNSEKQNIKPTTQGAFEYNEELKKQRRRIEDIYLKALLNGDTFSKTYLESKLKSLENESKKKDFIEHFNEWITSAKHTKTPGTVKSYVTTLNHILEFSENYKFDILFSTIDKGFHEQFTKFLFTEKKNYNSNVGRHIKNIKTFLNEMTECGINTNLEYKKKHFKVFRDEPEIFALSVKDLRQINDLELNEKLSRVRDLFLFEAYTGLRYSDIQNLKHTKINSDHINVPIIKTKTTLKLPLNNAAKAILTKYYDVTKVKVNLPKITNQKMNLFLKEIGLILSENDTKMKVVNGWNDTVNIVKFKGVERFEFQSKKHELLTSHTARRSFVTNALELGIPTTIVMQLVGHKRMDTMKRYTKHDEKSLKEAIKKFNI